MFTKPEPGLTRRQVIAELKRRGWERVKCGGIVCYQNKKRFRQIMDLRSAASFELITSKESLS